MRLIITFLMAWCLSWGAYAATAPDSKQITQELEHTVVTTFTSNGKCFFL